MPAGTEWNTYLALVSKYIAPPKPPPTYWFEQIVKGKVRRTWGPYQRKIKRDAHYAAVKCGHPKFTLRKYAK